MNSPQPISPRQRLQALLSIPERERTDAQWDEINQLEIALAPGNREAAPEQTARRNNGGPPGSVPAKGGMRGRNPMKKPHRPGRNKGGGPR
jgi:hypothetical protein